MQVQCVHCGKQYSLSDRNAGTHFTCPSCRKLSPVAPGGQVSTVMRQPHAPVAFEKAEEVLSVACHSCGELYRLRSNPAGKQFKCRRCGSLTAVTSPRVPTARRTRTKPVEDDALPVAEVVSSPHGPLGSLPAASPDLFAAELPPTSRYTLSPAPRAAAPPPPGPKVRAKKKRKQSSGDSDWASRLVGGVICMAIGVGVCVFAGYTLTNYGGRGPAKLFAAGLCIVGLGFKVAIGGYSSD